jgi:hypothetical protein
MTTERIFHFYISLEVVGLKELVWEDKEGEKQLFNYNGQDQLMPFFKRCQ